MKTQSQDQQQSDLPRGLSQPALRALNGAGIWRLDQLTEFDEASVKRLHGIGPKAMGQLRRALAAKGLSFVDDPR